MMIYKIACAASLAILFFCAALQAEVIGWRGTGDGSFPAARPPQSWSKEASVLWKTALPGGGYASPVLCQGRLYLVAEPAQLLAIDASSGEILWEQTTDYATALGKQQAAEIEQAYSRFDLQRRTRKDRYDEARNSGAGEAELERLKLAMKEINDQRDEYGKRFPQERRGGAGNAAATPACDGQRVFVTYGTGLVTAFDLQGKRLWVRHVEGPELGFGHSASPVLAGGRLIVHFQDLVALDALSGQEVWRVELPAKHGTSAVTKIGGETVIVTPSGALVRAEDGRVAAKELFNLSNNSPLVHNRVIYAHESGSVKALPLPETLQSTLQLEPIWESDLTRDQRMASAVWHNGLLYSATRRGILDVTDGQTGEVLYRKRLDLGELFSSVTTAGELIFISGRDGRTLVLRPGREYDEVAINELQRTGSTPIFAGNRMYLRAGKTLYCIGG